MDWKKFLQIDMMENLLPYYIWEGRYKAPKQLKHTNKDNFVLPKLVSSRIFLNLFFLFNLLSFKLIGFLSLKIIIGILIGFDVLRGFLCTVKLFSLFWFLLLLSQLVIWQCMIGITYFWERLINLHIKETKWSTPSLTALLVITNFHFYWSTTTSNSTSTPIY